METILQYNLYFPSLYLTCPSIYQACAFSLSPNFSQYSETSIYRAFTYRVPRFTRPSPFPPKSPVNRGLTVYLFLAMWGN